MTTREYNSCVDEHADGLYRFILKNLREEHSAQDVVQEAFIRLHENWDKVTKRRVPVKGWLFRTTGGKLAVLNEGAGAQGVFIVVDPIAGVVDRVVKMPACR